MAVVTRPCGVFPCYRTGAYLARTSQNVWTLKSTCDFIKTQLCTVAISLTLFNSVRLPREAFRYGPVPYLVIYSFWLPVVALPTTLLQLAMGQLSQQDPVGVWRAVPILKGIGYLKVMTSYLCCIYCAMVTALSSAYMIWIAKGSFPLKDCIKVQITPHGYENKMNASECFNSTFLAPFTENPQYLGVMAVLIFILWFFVPILLFRLRKSLKVTLNVLVPVMIVIVVVLCTFLSNSTVLTSLFKSCEQWSPLTQPYIWLSALVQALLSTHLIGGYLYSAGGTIFRQSDVRWSSTSIITTNLIAAWLWVLFWESIGDYDEKDTSSLSILVLIYQSSVSEGRSKEWPMLAFGIVFLSGVITLLTLLFPIYDKLQRSCGDYWRIFATVASTVGTALTVTVLTRGLDVAEVLDELAIPVLAVFTTAVEVAGFVFIYGWNNLIVDIEFLTGTKLSCCWISTWCAIPFLLIAVAGWWLRSILRVAWENGQTLWSLLGVFIGILVVMVIVAAIAVAKEEQFNLYTKMTSAFQPSRLWGPEEPMARYVWMSQRFYNDTISSENDFQHDHLNYAQIIFNKDIEKKYNENWVNDYQKHYYVQTKGLEDETIYNDDKSILTNNNITNIKKNKTVDNNYRSPNICIAKGELGGPVACNCNRHFTLNVPDLRHNEVTTIL